VREHDELLSGPHEDVEKENARLREKARLNEIRDRI
jgi:hypothetical protein